MSDLQDLLNQAETSDDKDCEPCRVAVGLGITKSLCEEFKELDCRELNAIMENPGDYRLDEAQAAIERVAERSQGRAKELLDYTVCLMKGECSPDDAPEEVRKAARPQTE